MKQANLSKLVMFDLDGTLAESKSPLDEEMASLVCRLLAKTHVAVISGGSFGQFQIQVIQRIEKAGCPQASLENFLILPTEGGSFYHFTAGAWHAVYENSLTSEEKKEIREALEKVLSKNQEKDPEKNQQKIYGEQIEDRGSQMTFSALGQGAPVSEKATWDPDHAKRSAIVRELKPLLPDFEINIGGMTSIDITRKGFDKDYGVKAAAKYIGIPVGEILYVGDSLFEGGNDYGAVTAGATTHAVKNVAETKEFITGLLAIQS